MRDNRARGAGALLVRGNINLHNRPRVRNSDGSISTVRSISIGIDRGRTALIPTVVGKRVVSDHAAIQHYQRTGQHLGIFSSRIAADGYAQSLHKAQAHEYTSALPGARRAAILAALLARRTK